jgi:hypothetical protein
MMNKHRINFFNKIVIILEWIIISLFIYYIIIPDWNKIPVVKDYFALLLIGEVGLDLYFRLKEKTTK